MNKMSKETDESKIEHGYQRYKIFVKKIGLSNYTFVQTPDSNTALGMAKASSEEFIGMALKEALNNFPT